MSKIIIADVAEQIRGVSYKPEDVLDSPRENAIGILRANNISDGVINFNNLIFVKRDKVLQKQMLRKGDILICASSGSKHLVGKAAQIETDCEYSFGAFCKVIRPKKIDALFLGMYFQSDLYRRYISGVSQGANINNIRNEDIDAIKIPEYSNVEQVNIAELLQMITSIIRLQKKKLIALDELIKSRFVEMFGDPVMNPKGWLKKPFLDMGECKNGMNFHQGDTGIKIHCLNVGDFKDFTLIDDVEKLPMVSLNEIPSEEYLLKDGDIVFVRSNGNKALVGRSLAVYPQNVPTTFSGFCIRYRKTDYAILIPYLLRVLKTESMRQKMVGRGANIQNLNQQILRALEIPVPPIELQNQFSAFVHQVDKIKTVEQKRLEKLQLLFDSLMQKYFG